MNDPTEGMLKDYQYIIERINSFRGPTAYILDTIKKVSSIEDTLTFRLEKVYDVVDLLSRIRVNKL